MVVDEYYNPRWVHYLEPSTTRNGGHPDTATWNIDFGIAVAADNQDFLGPDTIGAHCPAPHHSPHVAPVGSFLFSSAPHTVGIGALLHRQMSAVAVQHTRTQQALTDENSCFYSGSTDRRAHVHTEGPIAVEVFLDHPPDFLLDIHH